MKIGIDLGTTTCTVAVLEPNGRVRASSPPMPSLGAWRNGNLIFGEDAFVAIRDPKEPAHAIRDLKLNLGNSETKVGPLKLRTKDLVAELLRHLANRLAGAIEIEEAVIGTPVNVSEAHRIALLESASLAGFKKVRLVYEPTSALVGALGPGKMSAHDTVLVVDWGGGTLDLSLVRRVGSTLQEVAVDGDVSVLGGSQMDEALVDLLLRPHPSVTARLAQIPGGRDRLTVEIEQYKCQILDSIAPQEEAVDIWPSWLRLEHAITLRGSDVVAVAEAMADQAGERILNFLHRAGVELTDVTKVLFAGGVCQCSVIRSHIEQVLEDVEVIDTAIPQQLTGYGCARLLKTDFGVQLAAPFGVRQSDETFCQILPVGIDIGLGHFRLADFMVTDPNAYEAVFDFGILPHVGPGKEMLSSDSRGFQSLKTMFVRCQVSVGGLTGSSYDVVRLQVGISAALAVTVFATSDVGNASASDTITGIPLLIKLGASS